MGGGKDGRMGEGGTMVGLGEGPIHHGVSRVVCGESHRTGDSSVCLYDEEGEVEEDQTKEEEEQEDAEEGRNEEEQEEGCLGFLHLKIG